MSHKDPRPADAPPMGAITSAGRAHSGPWPHPGGCLGCQEARTCNVCGKIIARGTGCTNGRCGTCHTRYCTPGGNDRRGHGYGYVPQGAT